MPATSVSGNPTRSSRLGQAELVAQRAQVQPHGVAEEQQDQSKFGDLLGHGALELDIEEPNAETPTARPASMKTMADVIPRRSSGPENTDQRMMMTATVPSASTRSSSLRARSRLAPGGSRQSYSGARAHGDRRAAGAATVQRTIPCGTSPTRDNCGALSIGGAVRTTVLGGIRQ